MTDRWYIIDLNPEPWRVGPVNVGRKNGKPYASVGPDLQLKGFQTAVKDLLEEDADLTEGEVVLTLIFWRQMEEYKSYQARTARRHQADLTNLQKAIEDAIQDVLITNDRNVREVHSYIAEQDHDTVPCIAIRVQPWYGFNPEVLPPDAWLRVDALNPIQPDQLELT